MILVSDIGNTSITVGLFDKDKKVTSWRLTTDSKRSSDEYGVILSGLISNFNKNLVLEGAIVSSVVTTLTDIYIEAVRKYLKVEPINFSYKIDAGIKINVENRSEVGADRIVNAVAALKLYKTICLFQKEHPEDQNEFLLHFLPLLIHRDCPEDKSWHSLCPVRFYFPGKHTMRRIY